MDNYQIVQRLGSVNRPTMAHQRNEGHVRPDDGLIPDGLEFHSTDTRGATDENEIAFEESHPEAESSAHYFGDWDSITQYIPDNEIAWHSGPTANHHFLSYEMCEPRDDDPDRFRKFQEVWNRAVWWGATKCIEHGLQTGPGVWSHKGASEKFRETTHTDPYPFFARYGKTWSEFLAAIDAKIAELKGQPKPQPSAPVSVPQSAPSGFSRPNNAQVVGDDLYIRDQNGDRIPGRCVGNGDNITVLDVSHSRGLVGVEYPTPNGVRHGFVRNVPALIHYYWQGQWHNGSTPEPVLDANGAKIGSLDPRESATPLYRVGNKLHVVYNVGGAPNTKSGYVVYSGGFTKF